MQDRAIQLSVLASPVPESPGVSPASRAGGTPALQKNCVRCLPHVDNCMTLGARPRIWTSIHLEVQARD